MAVTVLSKHWGLQRNKQLLLGQEKDAGYLFWMVTREESDMASSVKGPEVPGYLFSWVVGSNEKGRPRLVTWARKEASRYSKAPYTVMDFGGSAANHPCPSSDTSP